MEKSKKGMIIAGCFTVVGIVVCIVAGMFIAQGLHNLQPFSNIEYKKNDNNYVKFNNDVLVEEDSSVIQKNFQFMEQKQGTYTLVYEEKLPKFFQNMKKDDIFCIYPDDEAEESFFSMGFCGRYLSCSEEGDLHKVKFQIPKLKEVFSDVYLNTKGEKGSNISSIQFIPEKNVEASIINSEQKPLCAMIQSPVISAKEISDSITIGDTKAGFTYKKASGVSLKKDYTLLCDKLKLNLENKSSSDLCDMIINGSVTLEQPAVKMVLNYHYNKKKDKVDIKEYSLGLITKQKIDLSIAGEKEIGLDDLNADLSDLINIIDIEDTTESEKGKLVLGTYLIGMQAALPILYNDTNKVSYLSLGIAIQMTITASGKLGLEYSIEESGFTYVEENSNGKNVHKTKGYDYPNPVVDKKSPTEEQKNSVPEIVSTVKGEASLDLACGIDVGICIMGMIPMKIATNAVEMELTRSFSENNDEKNDKKEIYKDQYVLDDNVNYLVVSNNAYLKMNIGAKVKLGVLKYNIGKAGSSVLLYKDVVFQHPNPIGFSHSQCGFGGVYVGEKYSDDELREAYSKYAEIAEIDGLLSSAKDAVIGNAVDGVFSNVGSDLLNLSEFLKMDMEDYKFDYYTSGVLYVRNSNDVVVAEFITDDKIVNASGFGTGLSYKKTEEIYSSPYESYNIDISIGWLTRKLLGLEDFEDMDLTYCEYPSADSKEKMELIYDSDELKLIILTHDES